ncbi:MAG: hypothetical protein M1835_005209 [Candelina submexicana]|nr:MAG: hypothetical protein M1835_005209 [Candelina submexicana]
MFSEIDIRWLSEVFPSVERPTELFPPLVPLESGSGFLKLEKLRSNIRNFIFSDRQTDRLDVSGLAQDFGVKPGFISELLPENPEHSGWILTQNGQIITRLQYDTLLNALRVRASEAPISRSEFIDEHGISNDVLTRLVQECNHSNRHENTEAALDAILEEFDSPGLSLIYSRAYRHTLEVDVLKTCQEADSPYVFEPRSLRGCPPVQFLFKIMEGLARTEWKTPKPGVRRQGETVVYTPSYYLAQQRDDRIDKLRDGIVDWVAVRDLEESQRTRSETRQLVEEQLGDKVLILHDYILSTSYLKRRVAAIIADLDGNGYAIVCPKGQSFPSTSQLSLTKEDSDTLLTTLMKMIMEDWVPSGDSRKLKIVVDYIVRDVFLEDIANDIVERAKLQARVSWGMLEYPGLEWQVLLQEKEDKSPNIIPLLRRCVIDFDLKTTATDAFRSETQKLRQEADAQFQALWHQRLMSKLQLYQAGIEALADGKLQEELRGTLEVHLLQNLLPDVIQKAEKRSMIRDKAMRRNVDSFKAFLASAQTGKDPPKDLFAALIAALETFNKRQKIKPISEDELKKKKESQMHEMVRSMREDNDAPRLFLTLVVVLLSTRGPGIVYSTGKFAPRLLKQLRGTMDAEQLGALETVKDAVKAGKLSTDQKASMISMAESAVDQSQ